MLACDIAYGAFSLSLSLLARNWTCVGAGVDHNAIVLVEVRALYCIAINIHGLLLAESTSSAAIVTGVEILVITLAKCAPHTEDAAGNYTHICSQTTLK